MSNFKKEEKKEEFDVDISRYDTCENTKIC